MRSSRGSRRTLVAMSGGVDCAAAAQLALDAGDEVVAVTLELWSDPGTDGEESCCSPQAVRGARGLAHRMGIPHVTLDLRERFRAEVVDRFLDGYAAGRTPNPCVRCNGEVRFDAMLELADALGAARLATGHYARIARDEHGPLVRAAADPAKDQSYMLAKLDPVAARPPLLPARRPHEGRRARARARGGPARRRQAREPGPLLRRRPRRPRLPPAPRRPARCAGRARSSTGRARCSAATRASTTTRSASAAASASRAPSRSTCWRRTPSANRVVVGPQGRARHQARSARGRHASTARRATWRPSGFAITPSR